MPGYRQRLALLASLLLTSLAFMSWNVSVGMAAGGSCSSPSFFPTGPFSISPPTRMLHDTNSLAVADFNHDGILDMATAESGAPGTDPSPFNVSILLGRGDGTFAVFSVVSGLVNLPNSLTSGDVNNDTHPDLAVTNSNSHKATILLNDGTGNFSLAPGSPFAVGNFPANLTLGHFNSDGFLDLVTVNVVTSGANGTASVLFGTGNGAFGMRQDYTIGINPASVAAGDFNGDAKLDLAVANAGDNNTSILLNTCSGCTAPSFGPRADYNMGATNHSITLADFDGDSDLDIATGMSNKNASLLVNNGTATFSSAGQFPSGAPQSFATGFRTISGDFNNDGKPDLAIAWTTFSTHKVSVLLNLTGRVSCGTPTCFGPPTVFEAGGSVPSDIATGDFNRDGRPDLAVTNQDGNINSISENLQVLLNGCARVNQVSIFDADFKSDIAVYRPGEGNWYILNSLNNSLRVQNWGISTDQPVPGDYDGDNKTDLAVFRPSEGNWYIIQSSNGAPTLRNWGGQNDVPVPRDYDGDGKTDVAVFRKSEGNWYIQNSSGGATVRGWGAGGDKPVPGDYDGDGRADFAVFRPSEGNWYIIQSADNTVRLQNWGASTDQPVPADYDADSKTDIAVFRAGEGNWYILKSTGGATLTNWGTNGDRPVPGDYDGDARADIAIFRPAEGNWYIRHSLTNTVQFQFLGSLGDVPIAGTYLPQ